MNLSHPSNVRSVFSILTNNEFDDDDDDKDDYMHPEAPLHIKILLIYEQPQGTGLHITLTLNPAATIRSLKIDLANVINVPAEFIRLIHQNTILENDKSLRNQCVEPNDTIVLRDNRLTYNFP